MNNYRNFFSFHKIFSSPCSTKSKYLYIYLCRMADKHGYSYPSKRYMTEHIGVSTDTIQRALKELKKMGLINKQYRYEKYTRRQTSSKYKVIGSKAEPYFYLSSILFKLSTSYRSKLILAYLVSLLNQEGYCFPSYKQIAFACSLSRSTAIAGIKELLELGYLTKTNQIRKNGGQGNNLYTLNPYLTLHPSPV